MPRFPSVRDPRSKHDLREVLDDMAAAGAMVGDLPLNFYGALALRPDLMAGAWAFVKSVFLGGQLGADFKNMVVLVISVANESHYCCLNHAAALRKLRVPEAWIQSCLSDPDLKDLPEDLRTRLLFAKQVALAPSGLTNSDFLRIKRGGLSDEQLMELVMAAGLAAWANIWSITADLEPDRPAGALE
jgi:uncharacterized peroxidase-related enzyme